MCLEAGVLDRHPCPISRLADCVTAARDEVAKSGLRIASATLATATPTY